MKIRNAAQTDVGMKRSHNEDSYLVNAELGLLVVADGMGGHAGGETASRVAIVTIEQEVLEARNRRPEAFRQATSVESAGIAEVMRDALEGACSAVFHAAHATPGLEGMGTTATALLLHQGFGIAGHVGDSRLYMMRGGEIQQITEDHSLVQEQVKAGMLTPDEARSSRFKNIITRSIGFEEDVLVDVFGVELQTGDRFLLCSDGLSNLVEDYEMREMLRTCPLDDVPQRLIELANARGGDDNITVLLAEVEDPTP
jgi:PPM family protein phosphatase